MKMCVCLVLIVLMGCAFRAVAQDLRASSPPNGSFEDGTNAPSGWSAATGADGVWSRNNAHTGVRAVEARASVARPVWVSDRFPVVPGRPYIADGWIGPSTGGAWLEVRFFDVRGEVAGSWRSPHLRSNKEWTYLAVDIPSSSKKQRGAPSAGEIRFWVQGGRAVLDDVGFHSAVFLQMTNGDFELPADSKGRIGYWNEETWEFLMPGQRAGSVAVSNDRPYAGKGCVAVTVTGAWFGVAAVHYPVWTWTRTVEFCAMARSAPGARAQLMAVWTDSAQNVLHADTGPAVEGEVWQPLTTGFLEPPAGARQVRPVLVVTKNSSAESQEGVAWFDDAQVRVEDKPIVRVVVNQVGYEEGGPKTCFVLTNFFPKRSPLGAVRLTGEDGRSIWRSPLRCAGRMCGQNQADWGWYFWRAEFSPVAASGACRLHATVGGQEGMSHPFKIGRDLLFQETAAINTDFFFVQRCGCEVPGWHAPCHLDDAKLKDGAHRDLVGGWHSAGDYNKLVWEYGDGGVMYALLHAAEAFPAYFEAYDRDRDGLCDVLDEAWWGAKFAAKVQLDTGAFLNHIEQGPDRKTWMNWCPPEKTTDNIVGTADDPVVIDGEGHYPLAAGCWARLSRILEARGTQNDYLERAVRLWTYATANGTQTGDPLILISAIDLYQVTKEDRFLDFARRSAEAILTAGSGEGQLSGGYGNTGDIPAAALAYFALQLPQGPLAARIKGRLEKHLPGFLTEAQNPLGLMMQKPGPDGYYFDPSSALGCNYQVCCRAWSAMMVYRVTGDPRALHYAADQLNFLLGANPYDLCMMEGKGTVNLPRYHHRYITIPGHQRGAVPGAIPNGFVRDLGGNDRPGVDLSTGGRLYPSYRTNEPWLIHNLFYLLAVTAWHEVFK